MAKAASPVRLERNLMEAASVAGSVFHRSAAEQVEYWADIGRKVSKVVDPEALLAVQAGLMKITLEDTVAVNVDSDELFASLDKHRESGALSAEISSQAIRYQAAGQAGMLEQVQANGKVVLGQFANGKFEPVAD